MLITKYEQEKLAAINITAPQLYVIAAIKYLPPPVTATEISKWINRTTNAVNVTVMNLVRNGMVKRTRYVHDRRHLTLRLTAKSEEVFEQAARFINRLPDEYMPSLTDDELKILMTLIERLSTKLMKLLNTDEPTSEIALHRIDVLNRILAEEDKDYKPVNFEQVFERMKAGKYNMKQLECDL